MAQAAHVFPSFAQNLGANAQRLSGTPDTIKVALAGTGAQTFNWVAATQAYTTLALFLANAGASGGGAVTEVSATNTGYTTGGATLSGVTWTESGLVSTLTATSPVTWTVPAVGSGGVGWTAQYAVFYDTTVSNDLICYWDFGGSSSVTPGGTFSLNISGTGLVTVTSS